MLSTATPQSVRKLAELGLNKYTICRWRMLVFSVIGSSPAVSFSGIVEADETFQRESRKDGLSRMGPALRRFEVIRTDAPAQVGGLYDAGLKMMRGEPPRDATRRLHDI